MWPEQAAWVLLIIQRYNYANILQERTVISIRWPFYIQISSEIAWFDAQFYQIFAERSLAFPDCSTANSLKSISSVNRPCRHFVSGCQLFTWGGGVIMDCSVHFTDVWFGYWFVTSVQELTWDPPGIVGPIQRMVATILTMWNEVDLLITVNLDWCVDCSIILMSSVCNVRVIT
jgi:hypothetical protein